jgi:integrase
MALTDYLKLRGRTYYVRVQIPPHLWKAAGGKREFIKTLKTGDHNEANRRKHAYVAAFKQQITALERHKPNELGELYEKALAWRETMERHKDQVIYQHPDGTPEYLTDVLLDEISEETEEFLATHGEKAAETFYKIAQGKGMLLRAQVDAWLAEQANTTNQTKAQHRTVLRAFIAWAGEDVFVENVTRRYAGEYVSHLLGPAANLKRKTAQRYVSSLSSLWAWLEARGLAQDNPWLRQGIGKKSKRGETPTRKQWTDEALVKVLSGTFTPRYNTILHDLMRLALVTGARLDELCTLKATDVHKREEGWWIEIQQGKTKAAVRKVPVHDSAAHVLERRQGSRGFLFEGLVPGGPDKKRSWNVSKAFGHYTHTLDLKEERQTFHSLRNTFVEVMEGAEVPLSTIELIIGHARQSLALGGYSKGQRVQLRDAVNKLHYAADVMRLIRKSTREGETSKTTEKKRTLRARKSKKHR